MNSIALVTCGQVPAPALLDRIDLPVPVEAIDIYALAGSGFEKHNALFIGTGADQRVLVEISSRLERYIASGRMLVFCGHVAYPFLDCLVRFVPLAGYRLHDLVVRCVTPHPVYDGIDFSDLTFRKGVAGFYGRGHNPPPGNAIVVNALGERLAPVDWQLEYPNGGVLFVHAGIDLWGYGADDGSAAILPKRLVQWVHSRIVARSP